MERATSGLSFYIGIKMPAIVLFYWCLSVLFAIVIVIVY